MSLLNSKYCLDANVLIEAWQKYYSPRFCPQYWDLLIELGKANKIFLPQLVFEEITRTDDSLKKWLEGSKIPVHRIDAAVTDCLKQIYEANPIHHHLVDNIRQRSLADPWVIAHALKEKACVVTKEEKVTAANTRRIKIPNVCDNMNIRWIDDFKFIAELNIKFSCSIL